MNKSAGLVNGRKLRDRTNQVLFVDLRNWDTNIEEIVIDKGKRKKKTILSDSQIADLKKVFSAWQSEEMTDYNDVPEFCRSVSLDEIREKDYSLAPSKYIEFIDHDLDIDYKAEMSRIQKEMKDVMISEKQSQNMLEEAFRGIGYEID